MAKIGLMSATEHFILSHFRRIKGVGTLLDVEKFYIKLIKLNIILKCLMLDLSTLK